MASTTGLTRDCLVSPLLFMLYIPGIERNRREMPQGFFLQYTEEGARSGGRSPGLFYADDIVLVADSLPPALWAALGVEFGPRKSALMSFGVGVELETDNLTIQGDLVPGEKRYRYLGVWIHTGHDYLIEQEATLQ
ncbi:uncharacterized protein ISCGN_010886 [Ixodes scapularis]